MLQFGMVDLLSFPAKICLTSAGCLIHNNKVLLVKHKKVGFWLNPGGHIEPNEAPHQAAIREFWEETGIKVKAAPFGLMRQEERTEYLPSPFATNLHWVCQDNYETRVNGAPLTEYAKKHWAKKGCEQHLNFLFLLELDGDDTFTENVEETDGISWFSLEELKDLDTPTQIKAEVKRAFELLSQKQAD